MDFIIGGLSATCAGVFTNPFDVSRFSIMLTMSQKDDLDKIVDLSRLR